MLSEFVGFLASITTSSFYDRRIFPNPSLPYFIYSVLSRGTFGVCLLSIINSIHILYKCKFSIFSNMYVGVAYFVPHTRIASVYPSEELSFCNPAPFHVNSSQIRDGNPMRC